MRDLHTSLRSEVLEKITSRGVNFVVARLQWSKDEAGISLHAEPSMYSTFGVQTTDFLAYLGFRLSPCSFFPGKKCYASSVPEGFALASFGQSFSTSFDRLETGESHLRHCGYFLDQPEGWAFFLGASRSGREYSASRRPQGDGHRSPQSKELKRAEDDHFNYVMSWIEGSTDKGWVFHYSPKHPPLSQEATAALQFLGIQQFPECPFFEFEPCHYSFYPFVTKGDAFFDSNANQAHEAFGSQSPHFSPAIQALAEAHGMLAPHGFALLPVQQALPPPVRTPTLATLPKRQPPKAITIPEEFDVAISFAGTERELALKLATVVRDAGFKVFYDDFYPEQLWGTDLPVFFDKVYRSRARFCVILVSAEYCTRMWTNHERRSAQARALELRGREYILPIRVDDSELPGLQPTIGYLSLGERPIEEIAQVLLRKLSV